MSVRLKYVGASTRYFDTVAGSREQWTPGRVSDVADAAAVALIQTGFFAAVAGEEMRYTAAQLTAMAAAGGLTPYATYVASDNDADPLLATSPTSFGRLLPTEIAPGTMIPIALYGDSRAVACSNGTANQYDVRTWTTAAPSGAVAGGNLAWSRGAAICSVYPAAKLVAMCGVSGDTLAQMVTRETAGASATRRNLDDAWSVGAMVLIFRAGINSITSLVTGGYVQATTDTIIAARQDLIQRAVNRGFWVIDEGEAGYDYVNDGASFPQSRIDGIRQTIAAVNVAASAFAAASEGAVYYLNAAALTTDSSGQWLANMCDDTADPGQRVHPSAWASYLIAQAEAKALAMRYGRCPPTYVRNGNGLFDTGNLIPNADLSTSSGGLGTGWTHTGGGSSPSRTPSILTRAGRRWQVVRSTFGAANSGNYAQINVPIPIQSGGSITVTAGQVYGFEFDFFVDDGAGGAPPPIQNGGQGMNARLRIYGAAGNVYYDAIINASTVASCAPGAALVGKAVWNPITMAESTAAITGSTTWVMAYPSYSGATVRIGVSNPRMVRIS